ncbi:Collectin-12 [Mactra antiquata]
MFMFILLLQVSLVFCSCRDGFQRHGDKCYHFSEDKESFASAQVICNQFNGHLAEVLTQEELIYVDSQVKLRHNDYYWIGLTDLLEQDIWTWFTSGTKLDQALTNWAPHEPTSDGGQFCVLISSNGDWHDGYCSDLHHFVCEYSDVTTEVIG